MDIGLVALIVLFVVVIIGFVRKKNVGLLAIAAAVILSSFSPDITGKDVISGFSGSLFLTLLGVTFLFGVVQSNGCLEIVIKKVVNALGKQIWLVPIVVYLVGLVIAAIGPGCVPALAFVAVIAIPLAHQTGYHPVMLILLGHIGSFCGRFSPLTPEGVMITKTLGEQGFTGLLTPIMINAGISTVIISILVFIFYKGYKVKAPEDKVKTTTEKLSIKHWLALLGIVLMIALVIFLKMNVGLASFLIAALLVVFEIGDEKEGLKGVPWGTLVMVTGVGVLMNLVIATGGIDLLGNALASIMTPRTAPALTGLTAGIMSWFSSAIGVVFPTMLPTIGTIAEGVGGGVSIAALASMIAMNASFAGISPASTSGAIILSSIEGDAEYSQKYTSNKLFIECFAWSIFCVLFNCLLSILGVYSFVA